MKGDPSSEKRASGFYVPRDEAFSEVKQLITFSAKTVRTIDSHFSEGIEMPPPLSKERVWKEVMPGRLFKVIAGGGDVLRFEIPKPMESMNTFFFSF
ncbi:LIPOXYGENASE [Salix viminalis]|uniref:LIPOXYGENASE n=1 Tax=Salix viminalis TaxID=40686 RepID=A0A9Q0TLU5_SALVM|nr:LIPOXYGENASE [Salix viminalis]